MKKLIFLFICILSHAHEHCMHHAKKPSPNELARLESECALANAKSCSDLANAYFQSDVKKAIKSGAKACELGAVSACIKLANGYRYEYFSMPKDLFKASEFYELACKKQSAQGCYELGTLRQYELSGNGVQYHERACSLGYAPACYQLGFFAYFKKYSYKGDALAFFKKGCEGKHNLSCMMAANIYEKQGDLTSASEFFKSACELRSQSACRNQKRLKK